MADGHACSVSSMVTAELYAWVKQQPETISELIRLALLHGRERRERQEQAPSSTRRRASARRPAPHHRGADCLAGLGLATRETDPRARRAAAAPLVLVGQTTGASGQASQRARSPLP